VGREILTTPAGGRLNINIYNFGLNCGSGITRRDEKQRN
jgi:hypothetical protein